MVTPEWVRTGESDLSTPISEIVTGVHLHRFAVKQVIVFVRVYFAKITNEDELTKLNGM